ncbi:MAG: hypothetical protein ACI4JW_09065 [Oscillospiraceae bacterium]
MKKITALLLSVFAAAAMLTGCSGNDGDVSSNNDNSERNESFSRVTTTAATDRKDSSVKDSRNDSSSRHDTIREDIDSAGDTVASKADDIGDDVADGIDGGLDAAESIVDDILR